MDPLVGELSLGSTFVQVGDVYINTEHITAVVFTTRETLSDPEPVAYVFTTAAPAEEWPSACKILIAGEYLEPFRAWWQRHMVREVIA